ncbi:SDR family oxidoreductase [Corynebacterium pacaense]|uniref:SDR family oxidoreductase n=1 Tax=Corynebacterium pacaense TaxID=1816684 RepID=UPI0009B96A6E|nr:SDR family oxidoreductase [Corynebacterium pacaense]
MTGTPATDGDNPVVLVAGSGGVIGGNVIRHFTSRGVTTRGISRRPPEGSPGWTHLGTDLLDADATAAALTGAADTSRLVFAAYIEQEEPRAQIATNVALLNNTLDALAAAGAPLEHVTLYQGMKYYGAHLGRFATPAREDDPRLIVPNFYYDQEDLLRARADRDGFAFTILRPEGVMGYARGTPMNLLMVLAAYVTITRELGIPLRFPGSGHTYDRVLYQVSDAALLADATDWAGGTATAHGEAFNLTNGDVFRWRQLFEAIAGHYGIPTGEPQGFRLSEHMPAYAGVWEGIVDRHGLRRTPWDTLVDWNFGDAILNAPGDNVSSTIKVRRAGFTGCHDSIPRIIELLDDLADRRIIPGR